MELVLLLVMGYFLGAIPFGYIVGKAYKTDIRQHGSGNVGFTNAWRVLGIYPALFVLAGDALKGYLATWIGLQFAGEVGAIAAGLIALFGHTFSCFIQFKGGKGIATGAGVLLCIIPKITLVIIGIFVVIAATTKYISLASVTACALVPFIMFFTNQPLLYTGFVSIAAVYVIYLHRSNIKRLLNGTENKIGQKVSR